MRPIRTASIIAGTFLLVSVVYLLISDLLTSYAATSAEQLARMQSLKGIAYVSVVAIGLFALTSRMLTNLEEKVLDLQKGREQLLDTERRTLAGTLAASIVHDANNLVAAIKANVEFVASTGELGQMEREALADANEAIERLTHLNQKVLVAAKKKTTNAMETVDLSGLVSETLAMIRTHSKLTERTLHTHVEGDLRAPVHVELLTHALINLVLNAADATGAEGKIRVSVARKADMLELRVEDDGPGIPLEKREAALEPFVTSKEDGTGLGLFSVAYCADQHRGSFEIGDSELGGAKMSLLLPLG
jgi:signal transduction histidine kinase